MFRRRRIIALVILAIISSAFASDRCLGDSPSRGAKTVANKEVTKRRVYVLHSGVHTILADPRKNIAAEKLREGLEKRGVPARDIVVLDNPYPTANFRKMFPLQLVT